MTDKPLDWRGLPAGLELDRQIAERLGWTELQVTETWIDDSAEELPSERDRLHGVTPRRTTPGGFTDTAYVPMWSTDLNAALTLFPPDGPGIVLRPSILRNEWFAGILSGINLGGDVIELQPYSIVHADTPALAVCRAFFGVDGKGLKTPT